MLKGKWLCLLCLLAICLTGSALANPPGESGQTKLEKPGAWAFQTPFFSVLQGVEKTVGDAPVVAFGECSHFMSTLHEFSNDMFRYLVERKGFRVFMLEAAWDSNNVLMDYIRSDAPDIEPWMGLFLNAFDSPATRKTLLYIRDYNKRHPEDPLEIAGMQPEQPWTDYQELNAVLAKANLTLPPAIKTLIERAVFGGKTFAHDIDVISFHGGKSRRKELILSREDTIALTRALDDIDRFLETGKPDVVKAVSEPAYEEAKLRVLGLRFYVHTVLLGRDLGTINPNPAEAQIERMTRDGYNMGDAYRFQIIKTQRETRFKGKKIFIWMHSWHAAKRSESIETTISGQPPKGTTSLGTHLFRELGASYKVIHSVVAVPDFPYPPGTLTIDNAFLKLYGDKLAYLDLHHPTPKEKTLPLTVRLPQFSQIDNTYGGGMVLMDQFDGVAYFPRSGLTIDRKK